MDGKKRGNKRGDELVVSLQALVVCLYFDTLFIIQKWFKSFFINHKKKLLMYKKKIFRGLFTDQGHVSFSTKRIGFSVTAVLGKMFVSKIPVH